MMMSATSSWLRNERPSDWWRTAFHVLRPLSRQRRRVQRGGLAKVDVHRGEAAAKLGAIRWNDEEDRERGERDHDQERQAPEDTSDQVSDHVRPYPRAPDRPAQVQSSLAATEAEVVPASEFYAAALEVDFDP